MVDVADPPTSLVELDEDAALGVVELRVARTVKSPTTITTTTDDPVINRVRPDTLMHAPRKTP